MNPDKSALVAGLCMDLVSAYFLAKGIVRRVRALRASGHVPSNLLDALNEHASKALRASKQ